MAELIQLSASGHVQTLDELWAEAESLGAVSVESQVLHKAYEATIRFERKSGTRIYARATHPNAACALADAINEARELGAGG